MGFTVDFSEFDRMVKQYAQLEKEFNQWLYSFLVEMAERVIRETKLKTPYDTGALRNAWFLQTDKISKKEGVTLRHINKGKKNYGKEAKNRTTFSEDGGNVFVSGSGKDLSVVITNPQEYATEIEYGHRIVVGTGENKREVGWYNGHFMLTTSIDLIQKQMPLRFDRQFKEFLKKFDMIL